MGSIQQGGMVAWSRQLRAPNNFRSGLVSAVRQIALLRPMVSISPTAIIKVEAGGRLHLVLALIDACTPSSVISSDFSRELRLKVTRLGKLRGCVLWIRGKHGVNKHVATHEQIIKSYRRLSPLKNVDPAIAATYSHIRLADPNFFRSSPIRIVLGGGVYPVYCRHTLGFCWLKAQSSATCFRASAARSI